jgi:Zn-dependent oligopeptidase
MKLLHLILLLSFLSACNNPSDSSKKKSDNPFLVDVNIPIDYAKASALDLEEYANHTITDVSSNIGSLKEQQTATFENIFAAMDDISIKINKARNNCHMLYWVSPDSLIRAKGLAGYQLLDSLSTNIYSDKGIYDKMLQFKTSDAYTELKGNKKYLVDNMVLNFEQSGVNLNDEKLIQFKKLTKEVTQLSSKYSDNMNATHEPLLLDEQGARGLPDAFKANYKSGEGKYAIPIINATTETVMKNAENEATRKAYFFRFNNRAADKNLKILDSLVHKRYELAKLMGYRSYAAYELAPKMAKDTKTVWAFINDLVDRSKEKAKTDFEMLAKEKQQAAGNKAGIPLQAWDISFFKNQLLKNKYQVNAEELRAYLPMEQCLKGMFDIYQQLLGLEFKKIDKPSVWHEEVEMYEVYEGKNLRGRFYLDLFPRPNKESWFYGVGLNSGKATPQGYEVPVSMLLGNFTRPTATQPSLLSQSELNTLFHEFGHIVNGMSYQGEFSSQARSKDDFVEAMSQIFENWIWDYDILSSFAKHYKTGEVLPKSLFDNMVKAKNVAAGLASISSLQRCIYDMKLYDTYNPAAPVSTDQLWQDINDEVGIQTYVAGTHPQASWIHINTHPVYMYGYLWSRVYAQDMFTEFEKNGLRDQKTGIRYRELILANGTQRDILEAVEEFLGRPSNNEAYIKSLGLN